MHNAVPDENDAISKINQWKRKQFIKGNDASPGQSSDASPGQSSQEQKEAKFSEVKAPPARFSGSDNNTETTSAESAATGPKPSRQSKDASYLSDDPNSLIVDEQQLKDIINAGVQREMGRFNKQLQERDTQIAQLNRELDEADQRRKTEAEEYEKKLKASEARRSTLTRVFTEHGYIPPDEDAIWRGRLNGGGSSFIAPQSTRGGISPRDCWREYERIHEYTLKDSRSVVTPRGQQCVQSNTKLMDSFFTENRKILRTAAESEAQDANILQGAHGFYNKDAPTTFEDFPVLLQSYLSQVIRLEHSESFVFWQAVNWDIRLGVPPGGTTNIPRIKPLKSSKNPQAWLLGPDRTSSDRQSLEGNNISLYIREYGTGKDIPPLSFYELVSRTNILDLENIIMTKLGQNYEEWVDRKIMSLLLSTTNVVYFANEVPVEDPSEVRPGSGGRITYDGLGLLRAKMSKVPPIDNGCILLFLNSYDLAALRADIGRRERLTEETSLDQLERMLGRMTGQDYSGRISGYKFRCQDFEVFSGTSFSDGELGNPGVQLESLGERQVLTRSSFAVGANTIGFGVSMPVEIRTEVEDFQRFKDVGWFTHAEATGLDIDPNRTLLDWEMERPLGAEEQLGVIEIRSSGQLI